jgi:hypothetical protein
MMSISINMLVILGDFNKAFSSFKNKVKVV